MNQVLLGVVKACTIGGCGLWAIFDFIVIFVNMMRSSKAIDSFGFTASFGPMTEVDDAWWLSLFLFFFSLGTAGPIAYDCVMYGTGDTDKMVVLPTLLPESMKASLGLPLKGGDPDPDPIQSKA